MELRPEMSGPGGKGREGVNPCLVGDGLAIGYLLAGGSTRRTHIPCLGGFKLCRDVLPKV